MSNNAATQTAYTGTGPRLGAPGHIATGGKVVDKISSWAMEAGLIPGTLAFLDFDQAIDGNPGMRNLRANTLNLSWPSAMTTGNFVGTLRQTKLDGTIVNTAISVPFNTDQATTMTDILADLNAIADITATDTDSTNHRSIKIASDVAEVTLSTPVAFAMSGGTPAITTNLASSEFPNCVVGAELMREQDANGEVTIDINDMVMAIRVGRVFMDAETALTRSSTLYARLVLDNSVAYKNVGQIGNAAGTPAVATAVKPGTVGIYVPPAAAGDTFIAEVNFYAQ